MGCEDKISDEYREYWEETVNGVFNQVMGTRDRNYLGNMLSLDFGGEAEDMLRLRDKGETYGLPHNRVVEMTRRTLARAIHSTRSSRSFKSGFAIDSQGLFYPAKEKAENICRELRRQIQSDLQPYRLDIEDLSELCGMTYEKEETSSSLAFFLDEEIPTGVEMLVELDGSVNNRLSGQGFFFDRTHLREIRKLLAGLPSGASLLFTGVGDQDKITYVCRGYALLHGVVPPIRADLRGRKGGTFYADGMPWFRVCGGQILVPVDAYRIAQSEICRELDLPAKEYEGLFKALSRQSKGASVVFVDLSCETVDRWYRALAGYGRAWRLQGHSVVNLTEEEQERICALSRIDGALIVDIHTQSLVYAGAVLDALGITEGQRDRGARGNSVLAHVANLSILGGVERSIAAAVYSEDGMVTSVLGSSYYGDRAARLKECTHPLMEKFRKS